MFLVIMGIFRRGCHVCGLTEEILELGRPALALLEVTAEDDLLAILSLVIEWCRGGHRGEYASKRHWENVDHSDWYTKSMWKWSSESWAL